MSRSALFDSEPKKCVTNGDRIRQMTDEELAKKFVAESRFGCNECNRRTERGCDGECDLGALAWLKQEAKDDAST